MEWVGLGGLFDAAISVCEKTDFKTAEGILQRQSESMNTSM
jgi:hypothetical protein